MPWVSLDDKFHSNRKVISWGLDGAGLYARALSYCGDHETDGFVPEPWVRGAALRNRGVAAKLTEKGAWIDVGPGATVDVTDRTGNELAIEITEPGYFILDYLTYNPSSVELEKKRAERSKAGRKGAQVRWQTDSKSHQEPMANAMAPAIENGWQNDGSHARALRTPAPAPAPSPTHAQEPFSAQEKSPRTATGSSQLDQPAGNGAGSLSEAEQARASIAARDAAKGAAA